MRLDQPLRQLFENELWNYHRSLWNPPLTREIDFINRTVSGFQNITLTSGKQSISTRSHMIHATPQLKYFPKGPIFQNIFHRVEMGDLLFIYKHIVNGNLVSYRGIVVQAKYTSGNNRAWRVDRNQFFFLNNWPHFEIIRPRFNRMYLLNPSAKTWATYSFLGQNSTNYPIYYSSKRMLHHLGGMPTTHHFTYHTRPNVCWDYSKSFLMKFAQGYVGENLLHNQNIRDFVSDIYMIMNWEPDPPGEPDWTNVEFSDDEGFGVVEFTITTENGV